MNRPTTRPRTGQSIHPREPGTYALVLACGKTGTVQVGRRGSLQLEPGFYVYVGSAFGPGGLAARIQHHQLISAHPHWHIDYLRAHCELLDVWFTTEPERQEHAWAQAIGRARGATLPFPGFGSSDCDCPAHLFRFTARPCRSRSGISRRS